MIQEVRRGNEFGLIYSLSFSRGGDWLACTSDSNIVHVFASLPSPDEVTNLLFRGRVGTKGQKKSIVILNQNCIY